jgi:hypothetical protein
VFEDTEFPRNLVFNTFGEAVYKGVIGMTREKDQSKDDYWGQILDGDIKIKISKSLDVLHNLSTMPVFIVPITKRMKPSEVKWTNKFINDKYNMVYVLENASIKEKFKSGLSIKHVLETQLNAVKALLAVRETQTTL